MKQICFLVCVLLFNSCQNTPEKTRYTQEQIASLQLEETKILTPKMDSIKKIDLNPFLGKKHFEFGNLVSDVKIIPLETNNKSLIGGIYKIITTEEYIYIMDKFKGRNIIIFDKSGKFIKRFSHGQGPGELSRLYDVDYDFKNDELVAFQHSFLLFFDKQGKFLRQERLPLGFNNLIVTDDGYIFKTLSQQGGNTHLEEKEKYTLLVTDKKFELNFVSLPVDQETRALSAYTYLHKNDNLFKITGEFTDSIYSYEPKTNKLTTEFVLDYDRKLPLKYVYGKTFEEFDRITQNNNYYFNIGDYFETFSQNIFFLENYYIGSQTVIYRDKKTGNMVGGTDANYDPKEIPPIAFPKAVYKDYFVSTYIPGSKDYDFLKDSKIISAEDKEKIKLLEDDDNPVLVYFKLREF
ncbi:6-bladed beta-propeller [Capnocytophaga canis]|uniref:6-bladed beta-propeller n=1 Tax=Capnocytophaga canis TaxID=1848903 RepID=UPI001562B41E|nr:6-bladed beta-propeller [Capnocytophaga canis]